MRFLKRENRLIYFTFAMLIAIFASMAYDSFGQGTALTRSCAGTGLTVKQAKLEVTKDGDINIIPCDNKTVLLRGSVLNGSGTVQSVGLSLPNIFTVSNSPVTGSGTLTATLASQTANYIWAAPNGSNGSPTFRALVSADIPNLDAAKITTGSFSTSAIPSLAASKITSGTIDTARLGSGTASSSTYLRGDNTWQTISTNLSYERPSGTTTATNTNGAIETSYNGSTAIITLPEMTTYGQQYTILSGGASYSKIRLTITGGVSLFAGDGTQYGALSGTNTILCGGTYTITKGYHGIYLSALPAQCTVVL